MRLEHFRHRPMTTIRLRMTKLGVGFDLSSPRLPAHLLGRNEISLSSVRQDPSKANGTSGSQTARLVMMTHETSEGQLRKATTELQALGCIRGKGIQLPVA